VSEQPDQAKQALAYLSAALSEYAATLAPSVRGPFEREATAALKIVQERLEQPKETAP
jgi:hypothetical protein